MREESRGTARRVARTRRSVPFRMQVALVALAALGLGYGLGYYAISMLTMPPASAGDSVVSAPRPAPWPGTGSQPAAPQAVDERAATAPTPSGTEPGEGAPASTQPAQEGAAQPATAPPAAAGALYRVQVGSFTERERALRLVEELQSKGFEASITSGPPYRVQAGAFRNLDGAQRLRQQLQEAGYAEAFISSR